MKKIHMPICLDGRASESLMVYHQAWFENRHFVEKLCMFAQHLRTAGFIVIDFNTKDMPPEFDPYRSADAHQDLTRFADLIIVLREGNSLGFGEGVLRAMLKFERQGLEFVSSDARPDMAYSGGVDIKTLPLDDIPAMVERVKEYFAQAA